MLLCSRCGFFSTKLQSEQGFLNLFLCGGKNNSIENQHFSKINTKWLKIIVENNCKYKIVAYICIVESN